LPDNAAPAGFQIGITRALLLGFGGLVFVAVAAVLALGIWSGRQNTTDLLRDLSELTVSHVIERIEGDLIPAEYQLRFLAREIEAGRIDITDEDGLIKVMTGALAAAPTVGAIVWLTPDGRYIRVLNNPEKGPEVARIDGTLDPEVRAGLAEARTRRGLYWGEIFRPREAPVTLINARRPIVLDGAFRGVLVATVTVNQLSRQMLEPIPGQAFEVFVLYGDRYVLAHPKLADGFEVKTSEQPLISVEELGDPIVAAFVDRAEVMRRGSMSRGDTEVWFGDVAGQDLVMLSRRIQRFGAVPWQVVVHVPAVAVSSELRRLIWAGVAGLVVLVIALGLAIIVARGLSRPLARFAAEADRVRDLDIVNVRPLPSSRIRELAEAAAAFNTMVIGLRWFETYVPRRLVHHLMARGDDSATRSVSREATILFTDIVGFTALSEHLSAEQTAEFLNEHFAMVAGEIEATGGTIDKFIGDAIMAFWGAPEEQADHAARAGRAALGVRAAIMAYNGRRRGRGKPPIRLRIGIHSGPVTVGNIGAPGRINYTVVGDAVNTANRLEQLGKEAAAPGEEVTILLSGETAQLAGDAIDARPLGSHRVRGRDATVEVFKL